MSVRQTVPLVVGVLWLTAMLMVGLPIVGAIGPLAGGVVSFGTWRRAPLYEVASPGSTLTWARLRGRKAWTRQHLTADDDELPAGLRGIEILDIPSTWQTRQAPVGVVHDRLAGTVSIVLSARGPGFAIASPIEQDHLVGSWGAVLAPIARARCPIARVTWQEWSHPVGISAHERFLATTGRNRVHGSANADYQVLLDQVGPHTIAHDVHLTVTVDLRRVRSRRGTSTLAIATEVLVDECRQLATRLEVGGYVVDDPLTGPALGTSVRLRSDPTRAAVVRDSLASAAGRTVGEWGPMAVQPGWFECRVDASWHRSYRIAGWPMLPVGADWMAPLLSVDDVTRTVTVVLEPVPLGSAAQDANRQLTSIEADHEQKERHGFRLTARERRRHADVETRERELAEGHPMFRHAGIVTVTAPTLEELDEACGQVEQAAAQSLLDLRPLAARQIEGWVASLPLGRSVRQGGWQ